MDSFFDDPDLIAHAGPALTIRLAERCWRPFYYLLEDRGLTCRLVNASR